MNKDLVLKSGCLYLLSAPPSSGKSSFILSKNNIPKEFIVSSDQLRFDIMGSVYSKDDYGVSKNPNENESNLIFDIMKKIVRARISNGMTTFVDAKFSKESDRKDFSKIASEYGVDTVVLFIKRDLQDLLEMNSKREKRLSDNCIVSSFKKHDYETEHESHFIDFDTKIKIEYNFINTNKIDVIGDTHGMYDETLSMISKLGYDENFVHSVDSSRKILFLGDFVDRGEKSIETLRLVKRLTEIGHYAIIGNHENKLINFYKSYKKGNVLDLAVAPSITAMEFMKLKNNERDSIFDWLLKLPSYYVYESKNSDTFKVVFTHANIRSFDLNNNNRSSNMYGDVLDRASDLDTDLIYSDLVDLGINKYKLVRGHIPYTNKEQNNVISLEEHICFGGDMLSLRLDELENKYIDSGNFNDLSLFYRVPVNFNFKDFMSNDENLSMYFKIKSLVKDKHVVSREDESGLLCIFKYSKKVFFKKTWKEHKELMKCRGIVFDKAGNIVQMPFDKVFNYSEPNENNVPTAIEYDDYKIVEVVDKLNGFLGCITLNPFTKNILITTSGSFDSDFTNYIKDIINRKKHISKLMNYFIKNPNVTLMFEVLHEDDPHIIEYDDSDFDIYLIGGREKNINSDLFSEDFLDEIANDMGLKRPNHFKMTLKDVKKCLENCKTEGYMIRDIHNGNVLCKMKSPYYLTTKFFGRLSENNTKMMYGNSDAFKKKVDEEFFPIIDFIVKSKSLDEFLCMNDLDKVEFVRNFIINELK